MLCYAWRQKNFPPYSAEASSRTAEQIRRIRFSISVSLRFPLEHRNTFLEPNGYLRTFKRSTGTGSRFMDQWLQKYLSKGKFILVGILIFHEPTLALLLRRSRVATRKTFLSLSIKTAHKVWRWSLRGKIPNILLRVFLRIAYFFLTIFFVFLNIARRFSKNHDAGQSENRDSENVQVFVHNQPVTPIWLNPQSVYKTAPVTALERSEAR